MNQAAKITYLVTRIVFNVMAAIFGLAMLLAVLCADPTIENLITNNLFPPPAPDVQIANEPARYKTWYSSVADVLNGNDAVAAAAEAEGAVLLRNENSALPLAEGDKVSLFGVTAYDPIYSLNGAGRVKVNTDRMQFFSDEFPDQAAG